MLSSFNYKYKIIDAKTYYDDDNKIENTASIRLLIDNKIPCDLFFSRKHFLKENLLKIYTKNETIELVAMRVGEVYPAVKDRLLNVIQLMKKIQNKNEFRPDNTSEDLSMAAFGIINNETSSLDFEKIIQKKSGKILI